MRGISKELKMATKTAAESLSGNNRKVYLENPFNGIFVTLDEPVEEKLKKNSELTRFRDTWIERDGEFYFVIENLMGRNLKK